VLRRGGDNRRTSNSRWNIHEHCRSACPLRETDGRWLRIVGVCAQDEDGGAMVPTSSGNRVMRPVLYQWKSGVASLAAQGDRV